jgi:hypothetical protein
MELKREPHASFPVAGRCFGVARCGIKNPITLMTLKKSPSYRQKKELTEFRRYFFAKAIKSGIAFPDRHQETVKKLGAAY